MQHFGLMADDSDLDIGGFVQQAPRGPRKMRGNHFRDTEHDRNLRTIQNQKRAKRDSRYEK